MLQTIKKIIISISLFATICNFYACKQEAKPTPIDTGSNPTPITTLSQVATLERIDTTKKTLYEDIQNWGPGVSVQNFTPETEEYTIADLPANQKDIVVRVKPTDKNVSKIEILISSQDEFTEMKKMNYGDYVRSFVSIAPGEQNIKIKVTAEDEKTQKIYTVNFKKSVEAKNDDASLNSVKITYDENNLNSYYSGWTTLEISDTGKISLPQEAGTTPLLELDPNQDILLVRVNPTSDKIHKLEMRLDGNDNDYTEIVKPISQTEVHGYTQTFKNLKVVQEGKHTVYIKVTAENQITTKEYQLNFYTKKYKVSNDASLSTILYSHDASYEDTTSQGWHEVHGFTLNTTAYSIENGIPHGQATILVRVKPTDLKISSVKMKLDNNSFENIVGNYTGYTHIFNLTSLAVGNHTITITVTAEDAATSRSYTLTFTKQEATGTLSSDASLASIETAYENNQHANWEHLKNFTPEIVGYDFGAVSQKQIWVSVATKATTVKTVQMQLNNGVPTTIAKNKGYYTHDFNFTTTGKNTVSIIITAEDKSTKKTYTIDFTWSEVSQGGTDGLADYGILLYGAGGGNLDDALDLNLRDSTKTGTNERVKMATEYRYSRNYQYSQNTAGTFRKVLNGKTWETRQTLDATYDMGLAENLKKFLQWGAQAIPAKQYILILWNHGDVWQPGYDNPNPRAVIFDDNTGTALSTASTAKAITDSGINVSVVYYDVCLMLTMETLSELKANAQIVQYVMGAEHLTPGKGGKYDSLLSIFGDGSGTIENKLTRYVQATTADNWWGTVRTSHDLSVVRMSDFNDIVTAFKTIIDTLDTLSANNTQVKSAIQYAYKYRYQGLNEGQTNYSTDCIEFLGKVSSYLSDATITSYIQQLKNAIQKAFVVNMKNNKCTIAPTIAVYINTAYKYENYGYTVNGVFYGNKEQYEATKFNQATHWGRIILLNE